MRPQIYKVVTIGLILMLTGAGWLEAQVSKDKTIRKSFPFQAGTKLEVSNKYGPLEVHLWEKDSVKVQMDIEVTQRKTELAEVLLDRVQLHTESHNDYFLLETILEKSNNVFDRWLPQSLFDDLFKGDNRISVNYHIWIPDNTTLDLHNKYGNVYLPDLKGETKIKVEYGDLNAKSFYLPASVSVAYGDAYLEKANLLDLDLRNCDEVEVGEVGKMRLLSRGSGIEIENVDTLYLDSQNDRIEVEQAWEIDGEFLFSKVEVDMVRQGLNFDTRWGRLKVRELDAKVKKFRITSRSTKLHMPLESAIAWVEIDATKAEVIFPPGKMAVSHRSYDEKEKHLQLMGTLGNPVDGSLRLKFEVENGELVFQ